MTRDCPAVDRISNLPESILHHILSFLHIEDVARTSVLSKRWKYIWMYIPTLHFKKRSLCRREPEKFMEFVDGTLHRHKLSNVDSFSLTWDGHLSESRIHSWISNVIISTNVKELSLDIKFRHPRCIPLSLFTCQSLTSLELGDFYGRDFTFAKYFAFPRLKRLKLIGFNFCDECWNDKLFSNSPVIEEMVLEECKIKKKYFCISIPTLKLLEIKCQDDDDDDDDIAECVLKIDAPRLVTITYWGFTAKEYVLSSFPELVEADICIHDIYEGAKGAEISWLVAALAHVKCLDVNQFTIETVMDHLLNDSLTFQNVKMLSITDTLTTDEGLIALLKAVPNMESLVFNAFFEDIGYNAKGDDDGFVTAGCLFTHLKSVCFQLFVGSPMERRWVKLILRKAKALQSMTVDFNWYSHSEEEARAETGETY